MTQHIEVVLPIAVFRKVQAIILRVCLVLISSLAVKILVLKISFLGTTSEHVKSILFNTMIITFRVIKQPLLLKSQLSCISLRGKNLEKIHQDLSDLLCDSWKDIVLLDQNVFQAPGVKAGDVAEFSVLCEKLL